MDETDLIARVYPGSNSLEDLSVGSIEASPYFVKHERPEKKVQYGRDDRETTEPPEEGGARKASQHDGKSCIEIRFSKIPRSSHGLLVGCSEKCDVILPNIKGPSNYHFSFTFDEQNRFIVKDLNSSIGTEVTYNTKGKGARRKFNWIVGGDNNAHRHQNINIKIHSHVQFRVIAAKHNIKCQSYIENVEKFRQGTAMAEDLIHDLDILRSDTKIHTGAHTPGEGPIYVKKKIGKGGFGVAIHCWNVSTGHEFVIKRPLHKVVRKTVKHDKYHNRWKEEAEHLKALTHPHIIKLLDVVDDPPELHLEYVRGGPLSELNNITIPESVVVLADFGLSKNAAELRTQCGITPYAAPEIFEDSCIKRYSSAVDVWSLGVVTCKILSILPSYSEHMAHLEEKSTELTWCNMVVDSLGQLYRRQPDSLKGFLLGSMLVMSPEGRNSAERCYRRVKELPDLIVNSEASDRISDVLWRKASIVYSSDTDTNEQSTIRVGRAHGADTGATGNEDRSTDGISSIDSSSSETRRRSGAPGPSSRRFEDRSTLKRPTGDMGSQSPSLKRRGGASISQSRGHSGARMLDTEVDLETAQVAAMLQDVRNGVYQSDHLPDPPPESIPSWNPWDPFEEKPFSWNNLTGGARPDSIAHRTVESLETDEARADIGSSRFSQSPRGDPLAILINDDGVGMPEKRILQKLKTIQDCKFTFHVFKSTYSPNAARLFRRTS